MSSDALVDAFRDPPYEAIQLAERVRQSIADELQNLAVAITVVPLGFDPRGHGVTLSVTLNDRRWDFVTTQRTDDVESSRFLVAMFRRALERKIASG